MGALCSESPLISSPPLPYEAGGWAPALSICWDLTFASPILFTNAHRCFNIISYGTRCYLSFLAPLRRHLPMFSRHDINSPKEACSLTDSPYWNLTDNDFVFAEAGAPWGVGGGGRNGLWACVSNSPLSLLKINLVTRGMRHFIVVRPNYISTWSMKTQHSCAQSSGQLRPRWNAEHHQVNTFRSAFKFIENHTQTWSKILKQYISLSIESIFILSNKKSAMHSRCLISSVHEKVSDDGKETKANILIMKLWFRKRDIFPLLCYKRQLDH